MVESTNQMQAFHEPPSRRPHCSSTQQWVTPELGLSSTPGQGIQTQAKVTGNSVIHNHQEERSPGISHAHCPQTLIPHMPVPPQESAPSLSPGQSFGCQSPLPWVTGTDQTEVSGFCGSYRVPSKSSLLPLRTLSPGGSRSQANKPHAVQYCVVTTTHRENRHRLPQTGSAVTG
jgi:hypothetical protein